MYAENRGAKIVLADSDRALLEMLQIRLDLAGYETHCARTGPIALEMIRVMRPTLVILELRLPELDGFEVLEEILMRREKLPFQAMAMARQLSNADIRRAGALGVRTCVAKPFSGADMLDRVGKCLGAASQVQKQVLWV